MPDVAGVKVNQILLATFNWHEGAAGSPVVVANLALMDEEVHGKVPTAMAPLHSSLVGWAINACAKKTNKVQEISVCVVFFIRERV